MPDIFERRKDVAAICGLVIQDGTVVGGPILAGESLFLGMGADMSGYMHRATLTMDVTACDHRALKIRTDLQMNLTDALQSGMKLVYVPTFKIYL